MEKFRKHLRKNLVHIIGLCILSYFVFHLINGKRGLSELWLLEEQVEKAHITLIQTQAQKNSFEKKVDSLRSDNINKDLLDEEVRRILDYVAPDEIVIIDENFQ